ncbi:protein lev-9-like [Oncorhynchus clarkii lewisi]|uniref:protein lev-9-like n=1 Tax=Oncorhynchus clarkii lewisi TaxID=490388 RepID=UPI0039B9BFD0
MLPSHQHSCEEGFGMAPQITRNFYSCTIESILTGCRTVWNGNYTALNRKALQKVVQTAQRVTGGELPAIQEVHYLSEKIPQNARGPHLSTSVSLLVQASDACPVRLLGNERRRTCPKPCTQDKDCAPVRVCVLVCQCGLSCVAPGTCVCSGLSFVASLLSPTPSFSALLEVRCDTGYMLPNGLDAAIRRCQGDRQWSSDDPNCTAPTSPQVSCPLPEELTNTFSIDGSTVAGTTIRYTFLSGELVGNSENLCNIDQTWQYPQPICQRVWCPPPQEVNQGYLVAVQRTEYDVGDAIYYLCKKNHLLDGPNRVTCQPNSTWSAVTY